MPLHRRGFDVEQALAHLQRHDRRLARWIDRVGPPSEIFTPDYIAALYRMEPGKYDPCFDSLEFVPGGTR